MVENIGPIKNPLTIIAIFAGIAEVSGTVVLPFIDAQNQIIFIYFLICFPVLLVVLFFLTLNFNNKVLYAPSDYKDEERFLRVMRFDQSAMKQVEERLLSVTESVELPSHQRVELISNLSGLKERALSTGRQSHRQVVRITVSAFADVDKFIGILDREGLGAEVYEPQRLSSFEAHKSIWLGQKVEVAEAAKVITIAKNYYKHLSYIRISDPANPDTPQYVHTQIYIGGATSSAEMFGCKPLSDEDFNHIALIHSLPELHEFIRTFYS